jgi:kynurenine 3-monooxygenase
MTLTMPLEGRLVHDLDGRTVRQPYGTSARELHHSLKRLHLNAMLMDRAEQLPNVRLSFYRRCQRIAKETGAVHMVDERSGIRTCLHADVIIGADGAFSTVRAEMQRGELGEYQHEFLPDGYKELTIPAGPDGRHLLDPRSLHVWPRGVAVLIAIPNADGSFTCTCTMPFHGPVSFQALASASAARQFFREQFGDVIALAPDMVDEFVGNPPAKYLTLKTAPWHVRDRVVLLGDACHSVLPFYGQGMNAAFEDCRVLDECLGRHAPDWEAAFVEYERLRKRHTDALADLSYRNYIELRDRVGSSHYMARKQIDLLLNRACPSLFVPLYSLITHTTMPYADAVERHARQERLLRWCGMPILVALLAVWLMVSRRFAASRRRRASARAPRLLDVTRDAVSRLAETRAPDPPSPR